MAKLFTKTGYVNQYSVAFCEEFVKLAELSDFYNNYSFDEKVKINQVVLNAHSLFLNHFALKNDKFNPDFDADLSAMLLSLFIKYFDQVFDLDWKYLTFEARLGIFTPLLTNIVRDIILKDREGCEDLTHAEVHSELTKLAEKDFRSRIESICGEIEWGNFDEFNTYWWYIWVKQKSKYSLYELFSKLQDLTVDKEKFFDSFKIASYSLAFGVFIGFKLWRMPYNSAADVAFFSFCIWYVFLVILLSRFNRHLKNFELVKSELKATTDFNIHNGLYERLGVDLLWLQVSEDLLDIADPDKRNEIMPAIADFRLKLTDDYGYILPEIRVMDFLKLNNEIQFAVRSQYVLKCAFFDKKYVIKENKNITMPENAVLSETEAGNVYWVDEEFCKDLDSEIYLTRQEYLKELLHYIVFKYIDKIFTPENTMALMFTINLPIDFRDKLIERYDLLEIKEILATILKNNGSLKDINFVFEKICFHSKRNPDINTVAFEVLNDLKISK